MCVHHACGHRLGRVNIFWITRPRDGNNSALRSTDKNGLLGIHARVPRSMNKIEITKET
jgi:hypothetical protein